MSITDVRTAKYVIGVTVGGKKTSLTFHRLDHPREYGAAPVFAMQMDESERAELEAALGQNPLARKGTDDAE